MTFGIWNNIDEVALFLGLERLTYETDESFLARIKQFSKWKYKTSYYNQMHSIPIQAGLDTFNVVEIYSPNPDLEFKCSLDWEYFTIESDSEFARVFINTEDATLGKILDTIDQTTSFMYALQKSEYRNFPAKFLLRHSNNRIYRELVTSKSYNLTYNNILFDSLSSTSKSLATKRRASLQDLKELGDYFLDEKTGYIELYENNFESFYITYKFFEPRFMIKGSELNLTPLNIITKYGLSDRLIDLMPNILDDQIWGV